MYFDAKSDYANFSLLGSCKTAKNRCTRPTKKQVLPGQTLRNIQRNLLIRHGYQQPTVVGFVDFADAFELVGHVELCRIMDGDGTPPKLIRLIETFDDLT